VKAKPYHNGGQLHFAQAGLKLHPTESAVSAAAPLTGSDVQQYAEIVV
jgi:hypothetical protein